jgi:hypothetical protein
VRFDISFTLTIADDVTDAPELLVGLVEKAVVTLLDDAIDEDNDYLEDCEVNPLRCGVHFADAVDFKVVPSAEEYVVEPEPSGHVGHDATKMQGPPGAGDKDK